MIFEQEQKDWLKGLLKDGIVSIVFTKADGNERKMEATLKSDFLPPREIKEGSNAAEEVKIFKENPDIIHVFDTEIKMWRSIKYATIKKVNLDLLSDVV